MTRNKQSAAVPVGFPAPNLKFSCSTTQVLCNGGSTGSIDLTLANGTTPLTYAWSGTGSGTDPRTNLAAGPYSVTVTDVGGCTATTTAPPVRAKPKARPPEPS
ncbi:MAG: SprB repeat-containing protein [Saprospiraceae bacterium]